MLFFIVNPLAQRGQGLRTWRKLEEEGKAFLEKEGFRLFFTKAKGDAKSIAGEITKDSWEEKKIVVVGGTGTLNEVVDGLKLDNDRVSLAFFPVCKENDFVRGLEKCYKVPGSIEELLQKKERRVDYGIVECMRKHRRFVVSVGVGFDAMVLNELFTMRYDICPKEKRQIAKENRGLVSSICNHSGTLSYIYAFLKGIVGAKKCRGTIVLDGEERIEFNHILFLSVHNHPYEGHYAFGKGASGEDGFLDLCLVSTTHKLRLLRFMLAALFGIHRSLPGVHCYRFKKAEIHMEEGLLCHVDGETVGKKQDLSISCRPRKLRIQI